MSAWELSVDRLAPASAGGVRILPVVHERIEMTLVARAVLDLLDPAGVAVELPTTLASAVERAVRRLPRISLVISQEGDEDALVWVAAPGDPLVEALRWALERDRPIFCVDPDLPYGERHPDPVPDPYSLWSLGPEAYLDLLAAASGQRPASDADRRREGGMALNLRRARERLDGGELLALVGAAHAGRVREQLAADPAQPFARVRRSLVDLRHLAPDDLTGLLPDPPLAHAVWEAARRGAEPPAASLEASLSRRVSVIRYGLRVITGEGGEDERRRRHRVVDLAWRAGTRTAGRTGSEIAFPDRRRLESVVWQVGSGSYREQTGEETRPWQRRLFFDYARRCARIQGLLVPGLFEWVSAARGVGDDNLAWEVFDAARTYPWQEESAEIPSVRIDGTELDLGTRKVRFRRRFLRVKSRPLAVPVRRRPAAADPAEWLAGFDAEGICSYPPEDLVIEDYGRFLQHKAISILSGERRRSEPFSTGLLDGIDVRETLRNLHDGRVWVEERGRAPGKAGSVVVIFDADPEDRRFPFRMTWLGEHDQESDMAFYSTDPAEQVVGPGIMRATYGGFMLSHPRGRLFDVWQDADYRFIRRKAEVLLLAAIDYSQEKVVVLVAGRPPAGRVRRYAAAQGKQVTFIPLAALSPVTVRRIRVLHLLAGRDKRAVARDYVW